MRGCAIGFLFVSLGVAAAANGGQVPEQASTEKGKAWMTSQGEWAPLPDIFPPGGQMKVIAGDPAKGGSDLYFRFPAGYGVPWHFHTPIERVFVHKGTLELQMREGAKATLSDGGYIKFPSKAPHKATCTSGTDCLFYLNSDAAFDIHLVDPNTWKVTKSWRADGSTE